ncbi:MAG: hypothetical protein ACI8UD_003413, partial [Planctomycetota bacterium]
MKTLLLASCLLLLAALPAQVTYHQPAGHQQAGHQQAGEQLVAKDVKIERLHTGMKFVEGPVWIA